MAWPKVCEKGEEKGGNSYKSFFSSEKGSAAFFSEPGVGGRTKDVFRLYFLKGRADVPKYARDVTGRHPALPPGLG